MYDIIHRTTLVWRLLLCCLSQWANGLALPHDSRVKYLATVCQNMLHGRNESVRFIVLFHENTSPVPVHVRQLTIPSLHTGHI